jgi:hypothetical protein
MDSVDLQRWRCQDHRLVRPVLALKAPASSFQVDGSWLTYTENWLQFAALPNSSQYSPIWFLMGHSNILFLSEKHAGAIYGPLHHVASCTLLQIPHIPPAAADPLRQDVNQLLSSLLEGRPDETLRGDAWLQKARMRREGSWGILGRTCGKITMVIYWEIDRMGYKML